MSLSWNITRPVYNFYRWYFGGFLSFVIHTVLIFPFMSGSIFLTHRGLTVCSLNFQCNCTTRTYSLCCTHWSENSQFSERTLSEIMQCVWGDLEHLGAGSKKQVHWFRDMSSQISRHIASIWRSLREEARGCNSNDGGGSQIRCLFPGNYGTFVWK